MTIVALFLGPLYVGFMGLNSRAAVANTLFVCFVFFCTEIGMLAYVERGYSMSFFFVLDVVGTLTLLIDIPWLLNSILPHQVELLSLLRGARAARVGARVARLMRLVRLIRIIRILKFVSWLKGEEPDEDAGPGKNQKIRSKLAKPAKVGQMLAESISKRVVVIVLLVLIVTPELQVTFVYLPIPRMCRSHKMFCNRFMLATTTPSASS